MYLVAMWYVYRRPCMDYIYRVICASWYTHFEDKKSIFVTSFVASVKCWTLIVSVSLIRHITYNERIIFDNEIYKRTSECEKHIFFSR